MGNPWNPIILFLFFLSHEHVASPERLLWEVIQKYSPFPSSPQPPECASELLEFGLDH